MDMALLGEPDWKKGLTWFELYLFFGLGDTVGERGRDCACPGDCNISKGSIDPKWLLTLGDQ